MKRRGALQAIACGLAVILSATGCHPPALGVKGREERVLDAVRHGERFAPPADSIAILRRWIAPPLLGSEFYLVGVRLAAWERTWTYRKVVCLDKRALPVLFSREGLPAEVSGEVVPAPIAYDRLNSVIREERLQSVGRAEAFWLARLAVMLQGATWDSMAIFGEAPGAPGMMVSRDVWRLEPNAKPPRIEQLSDGYRVTMWSANLPRIRRQGPSVVAWDIDVGTDGTLNVQGRVQVFDRLYGAGFPVYFRSGAGPWRLGMLGSP